MSLRSRPCAADEVLPLVEAEQAFYGHLLDLKGQVPVLMVDRRVPETARTTAIPSTFSPSHGRSRGRSYPRRQQTQRLVARLRSLSVKAPMFAGQRRAR